MSTQKRSVLAFELSDKERTLIVQALTFAGQYPGMKELAARIKDEPPQVEIWHDTGGSEDLRLTIHPLEDVHFSCPTCGTSVNR